MRDGCFGGGRNLAYTTVNTVKHCRTYHLPRIFHQDSPLAWYVMGNVYRTVFDRLPVHLSLNYDSCLDTEYCVRSTRGQTVVPMTRRRRLSGRVCYRSPLTYARNSYVIFCSVSVE